MYTEKITFQMNGEMLFESQYLRRVTEENLKTTLHTTGVRIQDEELVGRLGQRGCAAQISSRGPGQTPRHVAW